MKRRLGSIALVVVGLLAGMGVALSVRAPAAEPVPEPSAAPTLPAVTRARVPQPQRRILLVWTPRQLPPGAAQRISELEATDRVVRVTAGTVDLVKSSTAAGLAVDDFRPGWAVPLDAFGIRPSAYAALLPSSARPQVAALRPGSVALSETSARLRRLQVGDTLTLHGGRRFAVGAVVDDEMVGAAEVVLTSRDARLMGVARPRFLLVSYRGQRTAVERAIRRALPDDVSARIRGPGETPFLRHGDAVLPQALVKATFGEFAYRPPSPGERDFVQDPRWVREHIVGASVPILGKVSCHRALVPALRTALSELRQAGLAHLVDRRQFAGCWNPRLVTEGGSVSRHAWGIAVDLNAAANPTGSGTGQDPRLVDVMKRSGFVWGGAWLVPDPMHFEYAHPPP